ncbi:hypothetical protein AAVH_15114, partial [Aphelenchoides avenae]
RNREKPDASYRAVLRAVISSNLGRSEAVSVRPSSNTLGHVLAWAIGGELGENWQRAVDERQRWGERGAADGGTARTRRRIVAGRRREAVSVRRENQR